MPTVVALYGSYPLDVESVWAVPRLNAQLMMLLADAHPDWEVLAVSPGGVPIPGVEALAVELPAETARKARRLANPVGRRVLSRAIPPQYRDDPQRWFWADHAAAQLAARGLDRPTTIVLCAHTQPLMAARAHLPKARILHWLHTPIPRQYLPATFAADGSVVPSVALYRAAWSGLGNRFPSPLWVIPNWIDPATFRPPSASEKRDARRRIGVDDHERAIVFIGRQWFKGGKVVEEAIRRLPPDAPPVVLLSAGEPQVERIELGPGRVVRRLGRMPPAELWAVYAAADLGVVPSVCEEAFPTATLEMMACGLPVAGSRAGGIPEAVVDGATGRIVELPNSVDGWVDAIGTLLDDAARTRMGEAAHRRVLDHYTPDHAVRAWTSLLSGLT